MQIKTYEINVEDIEKEYERAKEYLNIPQFKKIKRAYEKIIKMPYKKLNSRELYILEYVCDINFGINAFDIPIPAKVLQLYKNILENENYSNCRIFTFISPQRSLGSSNATSHYLVVVIEPNIYYLIAQWGDFIISEKELENEAKKMLEESIKKECQRYLNNIHHYVDLFFKTGNINICF